MHFVRWIAAGLVISGLAAAGELPIELRKLAGLAASLPPEFQADALLQIVETRGGLDANVKKDLLGQASTLATQAASLYPKTAAFGVNADSRQAFQAKALSLKLDRLSLEMRAIRDLLAVDPVAARVLFQQVQKPSPPVGDCREALIPQLDDYYGVSAQVVSRGFTTREIEREEPVALLLQILAGVKAAYEVGPAARMIATARLTPKQVDASLNAFTARLEAIALDDRAFSETSAAAQSEISSLANHAASVGISRGTLARAYRKYLTSHYTTGRCVDSVGRVAGTPLTSPIEWFNQLDWLGDVPAIEQKELRTKESAGGKLALDLYWKTPDSESVLTAAQALRTSPSGMSYSAQEKASTEWKQKLQDFLAQLDDWKASGEESSSDFFHEKATVYEALIDISPSGDGRQRLMNAFVHFLSKADAAPVDCFWHAQYLHQRLRQAGDGDAAKLMTAYRGSGNLLLEVYAQFNAL